LGDLIKLCINLNKNGRGYILGDFFTNSSGHPAPSLDKTGIDCATLLQKSLAMKYPVLLQHST
jgi:hypothetical protein